MTSVVHVERDEYDVYIGRNRKYGNTKWGNPYFIGKLTRKECIEYYHAWIIGKPELIASLGELRGKRLGCHCYPLKCHGIILLDLIFLHFGGNRLNDFELED